jgi:hypothetical protein
MEGKTNIEFGRRRPAAIQATAPVKRSNHVALLLMGTFAIGGGAYALMPGESCGQPPGMAADLRSSANCVPRGSSSSGGHGSAGSWSRVSFWGGDTSSSRSPSAISSDSGSSGVTRGGFGGFAHAFASHFSRGG